MGMRVNPRERITQKSVSIKQRQREFLDEMEKEKSPFNVNDLLQAKLDEQIELIKPEYLER